MAFFHFFICSKWNLTVWDIVGEHPCALTFNGINHFPIFVFEPLEAAS